MPNNSPNFLHRLRLGAINLRNNRLVIRLGKDVKSKAKAAPHRKPVVFFNASTRLGGVSQNAAFALLSSLGLQLDGVPVMHFTCRAGMSRCPLGTNPDDHPQAPPCQKCVLQSVVLNANAPVHWFDYQWDRDLSTAIEKLTLEDLSVFEYGFPSSDSRLQLEKSGKGRPAKSATPGSRIPLGKLTLHSLRWVLRRHHLADDESTRFLFREFILSAYNVAQSFTVFLDDVEPAAVVVFNGIMFPEGTARWVAKQRGIRVITHEVAHQPLTAFFTDGHATAYPVAIPEDFELSSEQNTRLDAHLEQRFRGNFTMAGIQFWPDMRGLDETFLEHAQKFDQIVPVFTNVIFDTSQVHANVVFDHMFAWLDQILEIIQGHPETLFVIRAHPDELRPNSRKQSRETVGEWVADNRVQGLPNVVYIDPLEYTSSYALIQRAKFVMVYNSTIGLEAVLMEKPALCAGKARYIQYPCVFFPSTPEAHRQQAETFLEAEVVELPPEHLRNARRFQYYQLFRTPLPFNDFIEPHPTPGYVKVKKFPAEKLRPDNSPTTQIIIDGILGDGDFLTKEQTL